MCVCERGDYKLVSWLVSVSVVGVLLYRSASLARELNPTYRHQLWVTYTLQQTDCHTCEGRQTDIYANEGTRKELCKQTNTHWPHIPTNKHNCQRFLCILSLEILVCVFLNRPPMQSSQIFWHRLSGHCLLGGEWQLYSKSLDKLLYKVLLGCNERWIFMSWITRLRLCSSKTPVI